MTGGFFSAHEVTRPLGGATPQYDGVPSKPLCARCQLYKQCLSPRMPPGGGGTGEILVVAEAPGEREDELGRQLVGKAGQFLQRALAEMDADLHREFVKVNAINCRPPGNRSPTSAEIACCRPLVFQALRDYEPEVVLLLGKAAIDSYFGHRWGPDVGGVNRWRGMPVPDHEYGCWVCSTFHPSYVMREDNPACTGIFKADLWDALQRLDQAEPLPPPLDTSVVQRLDAKAGAAWLCDLLNSGPSWVAFDLECTGLKPHAEGHRIVTVAVAAGLNRVAAFPVERVVEKPLVRLLSDPGVGKVAHNMAYEEMWCAEVLGCPVTPWLFDTMLGAHVLDNRGYKTNGLKFQVAVRYGLIGYDVEMAPFLEAPHSNAFNQVDAVPLNKVLLYNGIDALATYRMAGEMMEALHIG